MLRSAVHAAFWKGWDMTLVILAAMPVLIIVGAAVGTVTASLGKVAAGAALPSPIISLLRKSPVMLDA